MIKFICGIGTIIFNIITSIMLFVIIALMYPAVKCSFKSDDRLKWNQLALIICVGIIAVWIMIPRADGTYIMPYPISFYTLFFTGASAAFLILTSKFGRTKDESINKELIKGLKEAEARGKTPDIHNFGYKKEVRRKLIHMMSTAYALVIILPPAIFGGVFLGVYGPNPQAFLYDEYYNIYVLASGRNIADSVFTVAALTFVCSFTFGVSMEIMRLRAPDRPFLLKKTLQVTRRPTEINVFGAFLSIFVGFALATFILFNAPERYGIQAVLSLAAIIVTSSLADMIAALIGRKWGKKKWIINIFGRTVVINKDKSYIGSLAGSITAYITNVFFVGQILALVGVLIFLFTDLILSRAKLSDNLTTPIIMAAVYYFLLPYVNPPIPIDLSALTLL